MGSEKVIRTNDKTRQVATTCRVLQNNGETYMWEDGDFLGREGSEGGQVLKDEIYTKGCRVTLEKCPTYYAITCGVFGAFCHTTFCSEHQSLTLYKQIKNELQAFMDKETTMEEEIAFYKMFSKKY